jgi:ABC-2 type transport system permease protein/Cu-processing system permease protein
MKALAHTLELGALRAVLAREFRGALLNRYFQVFSVLAVGGGVAAVFLSEAANAATFFLLQVALYLVSLFALLIGVSSARAENEEWPILFAQPLPRSAYLLAKFIAQWGMSAAMLALLFLPALFSASSPATVIRLYTHTLGLLAVFSSLGLCAGIVAHDHVQALILGVCAWLFFLFGLDLIALAAAQWATLQKHPDLWVGLLMANPLDSFRIEALFAMEQIPAESANKTPLAASWLGHASLWFAAVVLGWTGSLLAAAIHRAKRLEV